MKPSSTLQTIVIAGALLAQSLLLMGAVITGSGGGGVTGWPTVSTTKEVTWANNITNALRIGDGMTPICLYTDATLGPVIKPCTDANTRAYIWSNFTWALYDIEGDKNMVVADPDAIGAGSGTLTMQTSEQFVASNLGVEFNESDTNPTCSTGNYNIFADTSETRLKQCNNGRPSNLNNLSVHIGLNPRGATTINLESIVSNQPADYWMVVTDSNSDAVDFTYTVPAGSPIVGATTVTFTLKGVSKNASPSGNIDLDCAITAFAAGSETFTAHSTTGEVTALLTPATQNRHVEVTTSAHTINGGALAAGDYLSGSCEVDATATTSAQMSDFRLWGTVVLTFN